MLESLFNKVASLNFIKKIFQHKWFLVNSCEIVKNTYFVKYLQGLLFPIAVSAVDNVLTFNISILVGFEKLPK